MNDAAHLDDNARIAGETAPAPPAAADDLSWAVVQMRAGARIVVNEGLLAAYQGVE